MNGIINVYKEPGMTSFQVVARLRKIFGIKKVGHTGTLDPMAEGVLPICLGYATRFAELLTAKDKQYIAHFRLGASYDTFDTTGEMRQTSDKIPSEQEVKAALNEIVGNTELVVPAFSAKKIDGKRAYELARKGELEDAGTAVMNIYNIQLMSYTYPEGVFVIDCGKGTYVRSVIHEMGQRLGAFAAMSGLTRSKNGPFNSGDALKLDQIGEAVEAGKAADIVRPVEDVVDLPQAELKAGTDKKVSHGIAPGRGDYRSLPEMAPGTLCLVVGSDGKLAALGEYSGQAKPVKLVKVFAGK